jgi:lysophospholipase L1-like esterase
MNPLLLYFASGDSLYPGGALLLIAIAISPRLNRHWQLRLRNLIVWLGLAMIVMACPPFAGSLDVVFLVALGSWLILSNRQGQERTWVRARRTTAATLFILLLVLTGIELAHRKMPVITGDPTDHLVVIGDSLSSGLGSQATAWPTVMQRMTGVPVKNLARPGAQVAEGLTMAKQVQPQDHAVLLEIGGNDLLAGVPSDTFAHGLEAIATQVTSPGRTVVMFELPLLPNRIAYGRIQRRVAAKYRIWLIPKRYFTLVINGANATSDGLHLSELGTHRMAELVAKAFSRVLNPDSLYLQSLPE